MSAAQTLLTEDDGPNGSPIVLPAAPSLPDGLSGPASDLPNGGPQRRGERQPAESFEIIETDNNFRPLEQRSPSYDEGTQVRPDNQTTSGEEDLAPVEYDDRGQPRARETKRERRLRQRENKQRTFRENELLHQQVAELRSELDQVKPRLSQMDEARVQQQISELDRLIDAEAARAVNARRQLAEGITNQDTDLVNRAMDERDAALIAGQRLMTQKNLLKEGHPWATGEGVDPRQSRPQEQPPVRQPPPVPQPAVQARIDEFRDEFPLFMAPGWKGEAFTRAVQAIDMAVANEGFMPNTDDYWDEVRDRMREANLVPAEARQSPQRVAEPRRAPERRGPPTMGAAQPRSANGGTQVKISPERKQAMIAIGCLDPDGRTVTDRNKFNRVLKQYSEFDRANNV